MFNPFSKLKYEIVMNIWKHINYVIFVETFTP